MIAVGGVNIDEQISQIPQDRQSNGNGIDIIPGGGRGHDPADQEGIVFHLHIRLVQDLCDPFPGVTGDPEFGADLTFLRAGTDRRLIRPRTQQQRHTAHNDRFSRAGLAADHIEAGSELNFRLTHQSKVFQFHPEEHVSFRFPVDSMIPYIISHFFPKMQKRNEKTCKNFFGCYIIPEGATGI